MLGIIHSQLIDQKINILLIYECGESPYAEGQPVKIYSV